MTNSKTDCSRGNRHSQYYLANRCAANELSPLRGKRTAVSGKIPMTRQSSNARDGFLKSEFRVWLSTANRINYLSKAKTLDLPPGS